MHLPMLGKVNHGTPTGLKEPSGLQIRCTRLTFIAGPFSLFCSISLAAPCMSIHVNAADRDIRFSRTLPVIYNEFSYDLHKVW